MKISSTLPGRSGFLPRRLQARKFAAAVGALNHGARIVSIDWALSVILRHPGQPEQQVGPCLMSGAYRRDQVPAEFIDVVEGLELVFQIPDHVCRRARKPYVLFYTTKRVGGGVQDFDAIKLLKFAVS
jgi:Phage capsid family